MLYPSIPPHLLVQGDADAHDVHVLTSAGHTASVHRVDSDAEWAELVAYQHTKGAVTLAKFNEAADAAVGMELMNKLDLTIRAPAGRLLGIVDWAGGMIDYREPIAANVYGAVLPCFVSLLRRGARFLLQPEGGMSFRIPDIDWGLGDATAFLHADMTRCGCFSVLIVFGND